MATTLLYQTTTPGSLTRFEGTVGTPAAQQTITVELDAAVSDGYQGDVDVTEHAVETGANIADHARLKSDKVTVEGVVSNTPLTGAGVAGRAEAAFGDLIALKNARQLMTVITPRRTYYNMVLESLASTNDAKTGDALRFTATFKQVRLAEVMVKVVQVQAEPKANDKKKVGAQVAKNARPVDESTAHQILGQKNVDRLKPNTSAVPRRRGI